ncbi:type ISP restriction/modification enzyme [Streptomyces sp. KLOTTS4A1]|uniref:type ISP restriction/modification enzyme n=1 Tax=Streptomyces sp. KLOTTS4A1 TaxID=3390996 RepID=UPI0039F569B9
MTPEEAPLLKDLMPWSVAPLRIGRAWPLAPDRGSLAERWDAFVRAQGVEREELFGPSRARTLRSAVGQLPGQPGAGTEPLAHASGPCPQPVRVLHGPFDEQWLIADHRLIDAARPELWRVAGPHQLFLVEQGYVPEAGGPALQATSLIPEGRSPASRPGRILPLYRRPGGVEPNLAPGLGAFLERRHGMDVPPEHLLTWALAAGRTGADGVRVPLPADPDIWAHGVDLGHRLLWLHLRTGERPKLPGGRRPYVRAALPPRPAELLYDRDEETLHLGEGRISPVPAEAWDFHVSGVRVLDLWFARRCEPAGEPGTLAAIGPRAWPQERTSELLELITVLALLAELRPRQEELTAAAEAEPIGTKALRRAGVLPVPDAARRPASVLDHHEEGPGGQFALI